MSVVATLAIAVACWALLISRVDSFAVVPLMALMMGAMMLPSATPLVAGYAERHMGVWSGIGVAVVIAVYLVIWTILGIGASMVTSALPAPGAVIAAAMVALAFIYGLTPLQRSFRNRCRTLCTETKPPLRLGLEYGVSCVGCSAGVMVALQAVGPMNPLWMLVASAAVFFYKVPLTNKGGRPRLESLS